MRTHTQWSKATRTEGARSERLGALVKTFAVLAADLKVLGEADGIRLYTVTGDKQDPEARFSGLIPRQYPLGQSLQAAYDAKSLPVDDSTFGFALAGTAWRHLTFQEYSKRDPEMVKRVLERTINSFGGDKNVLGKQFDTKATQLMERYYDSQIVPNLPSPAQMPENMRIQSMVVTVLMRDRFSFVLQDDENGQVIESLDDEQVAGSSELNPLWQFLHGLRPQPTEDPFKAVSEVQALNALSDHDAS